MKDYILVINPGSTSTKLGLYQAEDEIAIVNLKHDAKDLAKYENLMSQKTYRLELIKTFLKEHDVTYQMIRACVGRGGLMQPIPGGTYQVDQQMLADLNGQYGNHASNLGAFLAKEIAQIADCPAYIVDPVIVDEFQPIAYLSGHPDWPRRSVFHALNQKAVARVISKELGSQYEDLNLIVAHLGGGISIGTHQKGRVIDVNNGLDGEGPFSPTRTGSISAIDMINASFSNAKTKEALQKAITAQGGVSAYLDSTDIQLLVDQAEQGNQKVTLVLQAMAYQISKEIAAQASVLKGDVQAIILTGGIAYSDYIMQLVKERIQWIAKVIIYPGEMEMSALNLGALRVLNNQETVKNYLHEVEGLRHGKEI